MSRPGSTQPDIEPKEAAVVVAAGGDQGSRPAGSVVETGGGHRRDEGGDHDRAAARLAAKDQEIRIRGRVVGSFEAKLRLELLPAASAIQLPALSDSREAMPMPLAPVSLSPVWIL